MLQGLANTGNTCSINTLIQCLGHCPAFLDLILQSNFNATKKEHAKYSIYEELKLILKQMWVDHHSLVPVRFLKAFYESLGDLYQPGEQFDFTEMWMLLLNNLLEEIHQESYDSIHIIKQKYDKPILKFLQKKAIHSWKLFTKNINNPCTDLLHGIQIQQIECKKCHHLYHNLEPMSFTYLELSHPTLQECIQHYLGTESIQDWACDECKNKDAEKIIRFWKLPKVWMFILKRFNNTTKITQPFTILPHFSCNIFSDIINNYKLTAIANHYGSLHGGHYNAICLNSDNQWYEYDDLQVRKIEQINNVLVNNTSAYALFYCQL